MLYIGGEGKTEQDSIYIISTEISALIICTATTRQSTITTTLLTLTGYHTTSLSLTHININWCTAEVDFSIMTRTENKWRNFIFRRYYLACLWRLTVTATVLTFSRFSSWCMMSSYNSLRSRSGTDFHSSLSASIWSAFLQAQFFARQSVWIQYFIIWTQTNTSVRKWQRLCAGKFIWRRH